MGYATSSAQAWVGGGSPTQGFLGHVQVGPLQSMLRDWAAMLDGVHLVGVVARRGLLRTFLRTDEDLRADVDHTVFEDALHADKNNVLASVEHGVAGVRNRIDFVWQGQGTPRAAG